MCWLKRKNKKIPVEYAKQEIPPKAPVSENALAVVWSEDKKSFGEVYFKNGTYRYSCWSLYYDEDYTGCYWEPIFGDSTSFFDAPDKAKQAAQEALKGK